MNPKTRNILIIIAVLLISASLIMDVYAAEDKAVVEDGNDVIQTISGKIYVGTGVAFQGPWVTLFHIKFPKNDDGSSIGAVTFPTNQITMIYHQGEIKQ